MAFIIMVTSLAGALLTRLLQSEGASVASADASPTASRELRWRASEDTR